MSVGVDPLLAYQGETPTWDFIITDDTGSLTTIAGQTIVGVIKATAAAIDPPLIGPFTCTHVSETGPMKFRARPGALDLDAGLYVVSIRREETSPVEVWQYVHAPLTLVDSASQD